MTTQSEALTKRVRFFGVTMSEFASFWKTLTNEEKEQFKNEVSSWDGKTEFV